ncbi:uncharacterized protein LOC106055657 [Biomphalaria glabrata]|uniref:Uncharacterized protein LOC106055657 n=1 Tax=Biomphalaria glabrata TaxID=6526 RepID=A0A9U8DZT2_BIOGL|nr:uncharacterized protein LOC106055657 [Biomphalaria glabrata]
MVNLPRLEVAGDRVTRRSEPTIELNNANMAEFPVDGFTYSEDMPQWVRSFEEKRDTKGLNIVMNAAYQGYLPENYDTRSRSTESTQPERWARGKKTLLATWLIILLALLALSYVAGMIAIGFSASLADPPDKVVPPDFGNLNSSVLI